MSAATNTLDDFPAGAFTILGFCDTCGRQVTLDRVALPQGLSVQDLRRRLRCAACGSRETSIRIVYTGAGGFRYGERAPTPADT
jgi:DNA-directed RNA polymerase subunit RPC12/RpoP